MTVKKKYTQIHAGAGEREVLQTPSVGYLTASSERTFEAPLSAPGVGFGASLTLTRESSGMSFSQASELAGSFAHHMSLGDCGDGDDAGSCLDKNEGERNWSKLPMQPQLSKCCHEGMAPIPMTHSRSSPLHHAGRYYDAYVTSTNERLAAVEPDLLLTQACSVPAGSLRPSWSRSRSIGSAFGRHPPGFSAFTEPTLPGRSYCSKSDPAISAFYPVWSSPKSSVASADQESKKESVEVSCKNKTSRGSKLLSGLRAIGRKRPSRSGRENPARPPSSSGDSPPRNSEECASASSSLSKELEHARPYPFGEECPPINTEERTRNPTSSQFSKEDKGAKKLNDPGVALSCSSSSDDEDDKFVEQIVGQCHLLDIKNKIPQRSNTDIVSPASAETPVRGASLDDKPPNDEHNRSVFGDDATGAVTCSLGYKTPARTAAHYDTSPLPQMAAHQNHESSPSSYDSHMSNSNSRMTSRSASHTTSPSGTIRTETSSSDADLEVREANLRTPSRHEEVVVDMDGITTVHSSSTTSSNFHTYVNSPRSLRDGATMPVDRFFAGGTFSITPPKNNCVDDMRAADIEVVNPSSLNMKKTKRKPLRFVAYESEERESPSQIVDYSRLNLEVQSDKACAQTTALIRPKTTKGVGKRLPRNKYPKPPPSPSKTDWTRNSGTRTPTKTPPPVQIREIHGDSGTPCSPPAIIDDPGLLYSEIRSSRTAKPNVVRSARCRPSSSLESTRGKMILLPPSSVAVSVAGVRSHAPVAMRSSMRDSMTVVGGGSNDGAQEVFTIPVHPVIVVSPYGRDSYQGDVLGATSSGISRLHMKQHPKPSAVVGSELDTPLVTPEKGS